jgi:hypothetical protein
MEQPYDDLTRNWSALDCDGAANACDELNEMVVVDGLASFLMCNATKLITE